MIHMPMIHQWENGLLKEARSNIKEKHYFERIFEALNQVMDARISLSFLLPFIFNFKSVSIVLVQEWNNSSIRM